jgi:hypothetical protein
MSEVKRLCLIIPRAGNATLFIPLIAVILGQSTYSNINCTTILMNAPLS